MGLEVFVFLIRVEKQLSTILSRVFPLSQRTEYIAHLINSQFRTSYPVKIVRDLRNKLSMNETFVNRPTSTDNFETFINSYIKSSENSSFIHWHLFNELVLLPHTKYCVNCKNEVNEFHYNTIHIFDLDCVKPACMIEGHCPSCHFSYLVSPMESTNSATRYY